MENNDSWESLSPDIPSAGWDDSATSMPAEGWGDAPAATVVRRIPRKESRREEDDEKAVKLVDGITAKVLQQKKLLVSLRTKMKENDTKLQDIHTQINEIMPGLHEDRTQLSATKDQLQGARLPPDWIKKAKDLNNRRKTLPFGCTTVTALNQALQEAEFAISHGSLTLKEEKAAMERVKELNKGRSRVAAFQEDQAQLDKVREDLKVQQAELKPVSQSFNELKNVTKEKHDKVRELNEVKQELQKSRTEKKAEYDDLKMKLDEHFAKVREQQTSAPRAVSRFFSAVLEMDAKLKREEMARQTSGQPKAATAAQSTPAHLDNDKAASGDSAARQNEMAANKAARQQAEEVQEQLEAERKEAAAKQAQREEAEEAARQAREAQDQRKEEEAEMKAQQLADAKAAEQAKAAAAREKKARKNKEKAQKQQAAARAARMAEEEEQARLAAEEEARKQVEKAADQAKAAAAKKARKGKEKKARKEQASGQPKANDPAWNYTILFAIAVAGIIGGVAFTMHR
mmetsp:Transcript_36710/g.60788  ORF Transcript_36710/g.60788 Transcript_36710/m.60788 type:complete len:516 (+) Transcript_36710:127-1674(+)